jgi:succinate dehydrogenase / fumarate reductase cytochrome b subunit
MSNRGRRKEGEHPGVRPEEQPEGSRSMKLFAGLFNSSLGKKFIMALTGAALLVFVVGHLVGNLQIFFGAEVINAYGHFLQSNVEIIWPARIGLLLVVTLHVWAAVRLTAENKAARPVPYAGSPAPKAASYASRTMIMSGLIIASFIAYHLLHYTVKLKAINFAGEDFHTFTYTLASGVECHDVHKMMVTGFRQPLVSGFYLLAMGLLCLHLSHGVQAMFHSLGLKSPNWAPAIDVFSRVLAVAIFAGYASIPLAVMTGIVR